jgi:hypothetical protein
VPLEGARARRIIIAILQNVGNWESRLEEMAEAAIPATGNKARALSLLRDMEMFKRSLCRLAEIEGDPVCDQPADEKEPDT